MSVVGELDHNCDPFGAAIKHNVVIIASAKIQMVKAVLALQPQTYK